MLSPNVSTETSAVWMLVPPAAPSLLLAIVSKRKAVVWVVGVVHPVP